MARFTAKLLFSIVVLFWLLCCFSSIDRVFLKQGESIEQNVQCESSGLRVNKPLLWIRFEKDITVFEADRMENVAYRLSDQVVCKHKTVYPLGILAPPL